MISRRTFLVEGARAAAALAAAPSIGRACGSEGAEAEGAPPGVAPIPASAGAICDGATVPRGTVVVHQYGTPLLGVLGAPAQGRCGYGTRIPLMVVSPFAKKNYIDHTLTDQSSVLRFVEDNWLAGERIQAGGSFDTIAGPIDNMFQF